MPTGGLGWLGWVGWGIGWGGELGWVGWVGWGGGGGGVGLGGGSKEDWEIMWMDEIHFAPLWNHIHSTKEVELRLGGVGVGGGCVGLGGVGGWGGWGGALVDLKRDERGWGRKW